ncbi:putative equilibrative nucleoside transporter [Helianthus annuus]|nr:putative equilibrative nucleoside transporter [Helianthus annuus]
MIVGLICVLFIIFFSYKSNAFVMINVGLDLFVVLLLVVPIVDVFLVAVALSDIADALVQGGVIGVVGEMPDRYMQAVVAETAASVMLSVGSGWVTSKDDDDELGDVVKRKWFRRRQREKTNTLFITLRRHLVHLFSCRRLQM